MVEIETTDELPAREQPEVVDPPRFAEEILAGAVNAGVGDLLDEDVGLAIHDPMTLLDGGTVDGLSEMTLG